MIDWVSWCQATPKTEQWWKFHRALQSVYTFWGNQLTLWMAYCTELTLVSSHYTGMRGSILSFRKVHTSTFKLKWDLSINKILYIYIYKKNWQSVYTIFMFGKNPPAYWRIVFCIARNSNGGRKASAMLKWQGSIWQQFERKSRLTAVYLQKCWQNMHVNQPERFFFFFFLAE